MLGAFHYFQSLPVEVQLMVWEEFLRGVDRRRIVLLNARPVSQTGHYGRDWSWYLEVDNCKQISADPLWVVAQSLLTLCGSSRYVATRLLDAARPSKSASAPLEPTLYLARDVFWVPDDLVRYIKTIYDSSFRPERLERDPSHVTFHIEEDIERFGGLKTYRSDILRKMECAMISLDTFEKALLWADPSSEWRGDVDIETWRWQRACIGRLMSEFLGLPNLVVMVDVPRGQFCSLDQLHVVDIDDATLYEMGAKGGPDRCLSAFQKYKALNRKLERQREGLEPAGNEFLSVDTSDGMAEGGEHHEPSDHVQVEIPDASDNDEEVDDEEYVPEEYDPVWEWWDSKLPKLTFAFLKP